MVTGLLTHKELITPTRSLDGVLSPRKIPIHPGIYSSPAVYTADFVTRIQRVLPEYLRQDITTIEQMSGRSLELSVSDEGITARQSTRAAGTLHFSSITHRVQPQYVEAALAGSNIALDKRPEFAVFLQYDSTHPMSRERLTEFQIPNQGIPVWYAHTPGENGFPLFLYFRNFAIAFNNEGLSLLGHK